MTSHRYLLTSESAIKKKVVEDRLFGSPITLDCVAIPSSEIEQSVEQPVGIGGLICCKNRILAALTKDPTISDKYWAIISIENSIDSDPNEGFWDEVHVIIYSTQDRIFHYHHGCPVYFYQMYWGMASAKSERISALGWSYTVGETMRDAQVVNNPKNWMTEIGCIKQQKMIDRHQQIGLVFQECFRKFGTGHISKMDISANLGYDFKFKKGVIFQDLGPIMANRRLWELFMNSCVLKLRSNGITQVDYVIGIGARGFYIGPLIAQHLHAGFVPIRKESKLPGDTMCNAYSTEYSSHNVMEIQPKLMLSERNQTSMKTVLIVDDLVATGGSLESACKLVMSFGSSYLKIVGCFCPLKVNSLVPQVTRRLADIGVDLITL